MWPRSSVSHVTTTISIVIIFSSQPNVSDKNLRPSQENCSKTMNAFMNIATISIQSILAITFLKLALCNLESGFAKSNLIFLSIQGFVSLQPLLLRMYGQMISLSGQYAGVKWMWRPWNKVDMAMRQNI